MLHKIIAAGRQGSTLDYLLQSKGRAVAPEVLRGDPTLVQELIIGSRSRNPRTTVCLSFQERAESVTRAKIDLVIDAYEELLFAGLDANNLVRCWIMHSDKARGRLELNCVIFNQELETGKVLGLYVHTRDAKTFRQCPPPRCRPHASPSARW